MALVNLEFCPKASTHTPAPSGYIQWHAWAARMAKTHQQTRCQGCGLYAIWKPNKARPAPETKE